MVGGRRSEHHEPRDFWDRYGRMEHESLEFKESANHLREVIPAMAMAHGGEIVLGVSDDRRLVGCPLEQRTFDEVMRRAQQVGVEVAVRQLTVGGVPLTVVTVPRVTNRIVTTVDGRILRRVGSDNVPLLGDEVARFVARRRRRITWRLARA
jgi:ATP-dependent DNA helicase RecG